MRPRRSAEPKPFQQINLALDPDANNLSTVLAALYNNHRYGLFPQLAEFMADVFPEIRHVDADTATLAGVRPRCLALSHMRSVVGLLGSDARRHRACATQWLGRNARDRRVLQHGMT